MTSINSLTPSSGGIGGYSSKGISGLASGMDTDSVVEAMTSDIQAKIDKIKQSQQKNEWKQDAYREVIKSLTSFSSKYFSYNNPSTNLLSSSMYNCLTKVAQGANAGKIRVTGNSNTGDTAYKITGVSQMATKAKYTGDCGIGGDTISTGDISFENRDINIAAGKEIELTYDNIKYTLTVPDQSFDEAGQAKGMESLLTEALRQVTIQGSNTTLGERLKFSESGGKLSLSTVSSSDNRSFKITGGDEKTLEALGFAVGDEGSRGKPIEGSKEVDVIKDQPFSLEGKKLTFVHNDLSKTISFTKEESDKMMGYSRDADDNIIVDADGKPVTSLTAGEQMANMASLMDKKLEAAFGAGKINVSVDGSKLNFTTGDDTSTLKIKSPSTDMMGKDGILGIADDTSNRLDTRKTLSELGLTPTIPDAGDPNDPTAPKNPAKDIYKITVNGKDFEFTGATALSTVISKINNDEEAGVSINYLSTTNKFTITADEFGEMGKVDIKDGATGNLAATLFGSAADIAANTTDGQDLKMSIRYEGDTQDTEITRNSNNVNLDGVKFNVEGTFGYKVDADGKPELDANGKPIKDVDAEAITFKTESDTDNTIKVIKEMAEEYNKILDAVNNLVTTKSASTTGRPGAKKYEPLTDTQKKEMTADEIKLWEEKAKEGILFGDSTLSQLASELRFAFGSMVGGFGFGKEIGITTASSYSGNGKITIDEKALKEALTNDPDKVKAMFTATAEEAPNALDPSKSGGFATRIKGIFESYAKDTGAYKGKLVALAGLKDNPTTNDNFISRQQKILTNQLDHFEKLLAKRQDRYQRQFSSLEVYISKMNNQSSWLSSAMG